MEETKIYTELEKYVLNWEELDHSNYTAKSKASERHEKMVTKWKNM